ncbi:MAG: DUF202 domain-containing protein [Actinomycetales bacterium]|nr:DUF202 domain-containing protein [Actinomycetales bacterium]
MLRGVTTHGVQGDSGQEPGQDDGRPRHPSAVYGVGTDPDPRFSLANERTTLAWERTALAVVAAGIGLTSLANLTALPRGVYVLSLGMCLAGGWLAIAAVLDWRRRELALRTGCVLPAPRSLPWLAGTVALVALALACCVLVVAWG